MLSGLDDEGGLLSLNNNIDIIYYEVVRLSPYTNRSMCVHGPVLLRQNIQKPPHPGPFFFIIALRPCLGRGSISDPNVK